MTGTSDTTRFAPSPTGHLHLGHAYAALFAWHQARDGGGRFLLRIEDIDRSRCRPEFERAIVEDLRWLGLDWDGEVRRQSDYAIDHARALHRLAEMKLLYPCFCTRKDIRRELEMSQAAPHGPDGPPYPGTCRRLGSFERARRMERGEPFAMRLDVYRAMARAEKKMGGPFTWHDRDAGDVVCDPSAAGDVVLARKDVPNSYHLAVTVDDAIQGVTLVTRGEDLFAATHVHRLLQALLDYPPPDYLHHKLLTDAEGQRFAKRNRSAPLSHYRATGIPAGTVRRMLGFD